MTARVFKIENRLSKVVRLPGGRTVAEALRSADTRIESVREASLRSVDKQVTRLAALAEQGRTEPKAALDGLYKTASEIFSITSTFSQAALSEASYGLCDLVENFRVGGKPNWSAIDVHVDAMRLLSAGGDAHAILAGLKAVRERYMDKEAL